MGQDIWKGIDAKRKREIQKILREDDEPCQFERLTESCNLVGKTDLDMMMAGPHQWLEQAELGRIFESLLPTIGERNSQVISLWFGLDGDEHTLESIGHIIKDETTKTRAINRERVRQIAHKALRKLRHPDCTKRLRVYAFDMLSIGRHEVVPEPPPRPPINEEVSRLVNGINDRLERMKEYKESFEDKRMTTAMRVWNANMYQSAEKLVMEDQLRLRAMGFPMEILKRIDIIIDIEDEVTAEPAHVCSQCGQPLPSY